jgi:hypothetical protein
MAGTGIQDTDWKARYGSLIAIGGVLDGADKDNFKAVIIPAMPTLIKMYEDPHMKVREAIGWVISKVCELHADLISGANDLAQIVSLL